MFEIALFFGDRVYSFNCPQIFPLLPRVAPAVPFSQRWTQDKPKLLPGRLYQHIYWHQIVRLFQKISATISNTILHWTESFKGIESLGQLQTNKTKVRTLTTPATKMKNSHAEPNTDARNAKRPRVDSVRHASRQKTVSLIKTKHMRST